MARHRITLQALGVVGGEFFQVGPEIHIPLSTLLKAWETEF
jgi:hypothetical protein